MLKRYTRNKLAHVLTMLFSTFILAGCAESLLTGNSDDLEYDQAKYEEADIMRGGQLYDKWWKEKGINAPSGPNPVWQYTATPDSSEARDQGGQWRCKECHGWDYKGRDGAYGPENTVHYSGVRALNSINITEQSVFGMISNGSVNIKDGQSSESAPSLPHAFYADDMLDEKDIYDLTKFIMLFASRDSIENVTGDSDRGKTVFLQKFPTGSTCGSIGCHNSDKATIVDLANTNEAEFLHKVRLGSPSSIMPGGLQAREAKDVLEFVKTGAVTAEIPASTFNSNTYSALTNNDIALGGLLYDKWWDTSSATAPGTTHGLWPPTNATIGDATWRCKECHGWDYRGKDGVYGQAGEHRTGIKGIVETSTTAMEMQTPEAVYAFLETNVAHGFDPTIGFTPTEYYALTKFIMTMRNEASNSVASFDFIDDTTLKTIGGNAIEGKVLYETGAPSSCSASFCHDVDGKKIDFADNAPGVGSDEFVHDVAIENPWEFIHKVRFGEPGSIMSGSIIATTPAGFSTMQTAVNILAYSQTGLVANIKRAGLLYDKWWKAPDAKVATPPATRNNNWTGTTDILKVSDASTWRCKECHGWDYQGKDGAYGDTTSKHYSGIKGFFNSGTKIALTETQIIDIITNGPPSRTDHNFGQYINEADIALLAQFILDDTEGVPPIANLSTAIASTDSTSGKALYDGASPGNCATCHGVDGTTYPDAVIDVKAKANAQEFIHKVRFGHPGSEMIPTSTKFQGLSLTQAGEVLAYAKTLGTVVGVPADYASADMVRGGRLYDEWWVEMQSNDDTVQEPAGGNPQWPTSLNPAATGTTWRCKSCHGWDYKGIDYFGDATNLLSKIELRRAGFPDVADLQNAIFSWIKNGETTAGVHAFGGSPTSLLPSPMTDKEIWDLTKFLLEDGIIETNTRLRASGGVVGATITNQDNGSGLFVGTVNPSINCASSTCHGVDGKGLPEGATAPAPDLFSIAAPKTIINTGGNPWEYLHKVRFGQPGTAMPSLIKSGLDINDAYDLLYYGQYEFSGR